MILPREITFRSPAEAEATLRRIGVHPHGIEAMLPKMGHHTLLLVGLECRLANIVKQEMLAVGGDAAVARGAVSCSVPRSDALLMGTTKQLLRFAEKLGRQPFGLEQIGRGVRRVLENMAAEAFTLRTPRRELRLGERTWIMGILNVTPDSFSDGGMFASPAEAIAHGMRLVEEGADFIDVGGESSRPGALPVSLEEELARVVPVVEGLAARTERPISVDTTKAAVAAAAIAAGAEIINDITAMSGDAGMPAVAAASGAAVVLMHMRGRPVDMQQGDLSYGDLLGEIGAFLGRQIEAAVAGGIAEERLLVDPGIGFGKTAADNLKLIGRLGELKGLGRPIVAGPSRKSFLGRLTGDEGGARLEGTAAAVTAAILAGAHIVRVHDVKAMRKVAAVADAVVRSSRR